MEIQKILLIEPGYFAAQSPSPVSCHIASFIAERGNKLLSFILSPQPSSSRRFEEGLHFIKQADLAVFLVEEESLLVGIYLNLLLSQGKRTLLFSTKPQIVERLKSVTYKPFFVYLYKEVSEIISVLKLFKL
jgi:hypothetical protein